MMEGREELSWTPPSVLQAGAECEPQGSRLRDQSWMCERSGSVQAPADSSFSFCPQWALALGIHTTPLPQPRDPRGPSGQEEQIPAYPLFTSLGQSGSWSIHKNHMRHPSGDGGGGGSSAPQPGVCFSNAGESWWRLASKHRWWEWPGGDVFWKYL